MPLYRVISLVAVMAFLALRPDSARADPDLSGIVESLGKLSTSAANLAKAAKASDDRGARKKFGSAAAELADDLAALAKRASKNVALGAIATDAATIDKDANALIELADEASDKEERKSLRGQAVLLEQGIASVRKSIDAVKDTAKAPQPAQRFSGRLFNTSGADKCSFSENLKFVVSRDGQQVFATQNMVFPGKDIPLVLDKGRYLVQLLDTSGKFMGQATLDANREGWAFKSGCVNQD